MLSRAVFEQGWSALGTRFNVKDSAKKGYYEYLERRITDADYQAACSHLFATASRFPIPADFIAAVPHTMSEDWNAYRTWTCDDCGGTGRSLGQPKLYICSQCIEEIGRDRLRQLKAKGESVRDLGGAMVVGLNTILEARGQKGL